jgi:phosphoglycolate phosphatase
MILPTPRAVIFDWDSTLVDNWGAITRALERTFTIMGQVPWTEMEVRARAKKSLRDTFPGLFGDRAEEATREFYAGFEAVHLETLIILEGASDLLDGLATRGIPTAVVSNKSGGYLRREAAHLGWDRYFHRIVGATMRHGTSLPRTLSIWRWTARASRPARMSGLSATRPSTWLARMPRAVPPC